jgi:hypothetical protein
LAGVWALGTSSLPTRNLVLRDLQVDGRGSPGAGVRLDPTSSRTTLYDSVCVSEFSSSVSDQSGGSTIQARDPAGACTP